MQMPLQNLSNILLMGKSLSLIVFPCSKFLIGLYNLPLLSSICMIKRFSTEVSFIFSQDASLTFNLNDGGFYPRYSFL